MIIERNRIENYIHVLPPDAYSKRMCNLPAMGVVLVDEDAMKSDESTFCNKNPAHPVPVRTSKIKVYYS